MGEKYITRGMRAKCEFGSAETGNFLNVVVDHGVIVGPNPEPLMNANDHTSDNITQFGNCTSSTNPKRAMQKAITNGVVAALGGGVLSIFTKAITGKSAADLLEDVGIAACKCTPDTPQVWQCSSAEHLLDGAPVLTMESVLHCRNGGTITMLPLDQYPADNSEAPAESEAAEEDSVDVVAEAANQALIDAVQKIDAATPADATSATNVAAPANGDTGASSAGVAAAQMFSMAAIATLPAYSATAVMSALGVSSQNQFSVVSTSAKARQENLVYNSSLSIPPDAMDSRGNIVDASKLTEFKIADLPVSSAGGGAIATYNVMNMMNLQQPMSLPEVIYNMEGYGLLQSGDEFASPGLADFFAKQGCNVQYLLPGEAIEISGDTPFSTVNLSLSDSGAINYLTGDVGKTASVFSLHVAR